MIIRNSKNLGVCKASLDGEGPISGKVNQLLGHERKVIYEIMGISVFHNATRKMVMYPRRVL